MSAIKDRYGKILALAVDPGAQEGEAVAALRKLREMVRRDPTLAEPPPPPPDPVVSDWTPTEEEAATKITNVSAFWFLIFLNNLSEQAYKLNVKTKFTCDPLTVQALMDIDVRYSGTREAVDAFAAQITWLINYINSQPPQP